LVCYGRVNQLAYFCIPVVYSYLAVRILYMGFSVQKSTYLSLVIVIRSPLHRFLWFAKTNPFPIMSMKIYSDRWRYTVPIEDQNVLIWFCFFMGSIWGLFLYGGLHLVFIIYKHKKLYNHTHQFGALSRAGRPCGRPLCLLRYTFWRVSAEQVFGTSSESNFLQLFGLYSGCCCFCCNAALMVTALLFAPGN